MKINFLKEREELTIEYNYRNLPFDRRVVRAYFQLIRAIHVHRQYRTDVSYAYAYYGTHRAQGMQLTHLFFMPCESSISHNRSDHSPLQEAIWRNDVHKLSHSKRRIHKLLRFLQHQVEGTQEIFLHLLSGYSTRESVLNNQLAYFNSYHAWIPINKTIRSATSLRWVSLFHFGKLSSASSRWRTKALFRWCDKDGTNALTDDLSSSVHFRFFLVVSGLFNPDVTVTFYGSCYQVFRNGR